jgi:hypothetical protein
MTSQQRDLTQTRISPAPNSVSLAGRDAYLAMENSA